MINVTGQIHERIVLPKIMNETFYIFLRSFLVVPVREIVVKLCVAGSFYMFCGLMDIAMLVQYWPRHALFTSLGYRMTHNSIFRTELFVL